MAHDGDLALDDNGDLLIEQGDLVIWTGKDSILSDLKARLATFQGEWFLDLSEGVPYFQEVFVKRPNISAVRTAISERILGTDGIKSLRDLQLSFDKVRRKLTINYSANSDVGLLTQNQVEVGA